MDTTPTIKKKEFVPLYIMLPAHLNILCHIVQAMNRVRSASAGNTATKFRTEVMTRILQIVTYTVVER